MTFTAKLEVYSGPGGWWYVETPELIGPPGAFGMRGAGFGGWNQLCHQTLAYEGVARSWIPTTS